MKPAFPLLALALSACASARPAAAPVLAEGESRYEYGRVVVYEQAYDFSNTVILARDAAKVKEYGDLLKAALPDLYGGRWGVQRGLKMDGPVIETIDEYVAGGRLARAELCGPTAKETSPLCEVPEPDYSAFEKELRSRLEGFDVLVLRRTKKDQVRENP